MLPPGELSDDAQWFIDGSLLDESRRLARRTGFGIVVVETTGMLLAFGKGVPSSWVFDAVGAELWAFSVVTRGDRRQLAKRSIPQDV